MSPSLKPGPGPFGDAPPQVIATAGHVDHGKSALVLRLTGMDPDRWPEEKRRGLTIDLGFAWTRLPSGREIGFVDVPGHERFIRNMLAGVGPVRMVLFVVAADEGWKPQSEEHLQIVDVLGVAGSVIALTKCDLVEDEALRDGVADVRKRVEGTRLEDARIVECSSTTGAGLDELRTALDEMLRSAPSPEMRARPRLYLDRVFTIRGAGTVVTGTLTGGSLAVGQEAEILPHGLRARIRAMQTHKRSLQVAVPVSRVAVNLAGTPATELERGDILSLPGEWRPTSSFEGWIRPVRGMNRPLSARGAYKLYAGSAERDARVRFFGAPEVRSGQRVFLRVVLNAPLVLDLGDGFVLREAGRRETVAGGAVLDPDPPARAGESPEARLSALLGVERRDASKLILSDRGVLRARDVLAGIGVHADELAALGALRLGAWLVDPAWLEGVTARLKADLATYHSEHPLRPGMPVAEARTSLALGRAAVRDPALAEAVLEHLAASGLIVREGPAVRLPRHRASTAGREDADRLVEAVARAEPTPPTVRELISSGFGEELVKAATSEGRLIRVSAEIVVTPGFLTRAEETVRAEAPLRGITVSAFRERLGTSRKYALPLLEYLDATGITKRLGNVRVLKSTSSPR